MEILQKKHSLDEKNELTEDTIADFQFEPPAEGTPAALALAG